MNWINSQQALDRMIAHIRGAAAIALDTEADSLHSYFDKVCLIQISGAGEDFVIDPLARVALSSLRPVLADPGVVKVLHGADYDLRILNRDFGFVVTNLIDTMICAQLLGYEAIGLAALLKRHFNLELDKTHQRADWAMRPLPPQMLEYAATDTRHLLDLAAILRAELESAERWEWAREEFSRLEAIRYRPADEDPEAFRKLKGANALEPRSLAVVARLHGWRDRLARAADRPPFKVASNEMLVEIARTLPRTRDALARVKGMSSFHLNRYGGEFLKIVEEVVQLPASELPEKSVAKPWVRDRRLEALIDRLKQVRDDVAARLKIDPAVLAPKHILTAVATLAPSSMDDLKSIPAMRDWQRQVIGERLLEVCHPERSEGSFVRSAQAEPKILRRFAPQDDTE